MNVLFVGAHHDDLEVSSGGSVKRWVEEGCNVFSAILTDSTWTGPDGTRFRDPQQVESYCQKAARLLGYTQISLGIRLRRDSGVSVMYAEGLNSTKSSGSLQRTDRHGILGQKSSDFQLFL